MPNSSNRSIDRTLLGATPADQIEHGSGGNERVFYIRQIFKAGTWPSDYLVFSDKSGTLVGEVITLQPQSPGLSTNED